MTTRTSTFEHRGWEIVRLSNGSVEVDLLPGKGGDILAVRVGGENVLYETPWGLPWKGSAPLDGGSHLHFLDAWPGGWQTLFPTSGGETTIAGAAQPFHGEAARAAWDFDSVEGGAVLTTRLRRSPFALTRSVRLDGPAVCLSERVVNEGADAISVVWTHHPAFGGPLIGPGARLSAPGATVLTDPAVPLSMSGLQPDRRAAFPEGLDSDGAAVDMSVVPQLADGVTRMFYLTDLSTEPVVLENTEAGFRVALDWDRTLLPYVWVWTEAGGSKGAPFFGRGHVIAVEPSMVCPEEGYDEAVSNGQARAVLARETVELWVRLTVTNRRTE